MLKLKNITLRSGKEAEAQTILQDVSLRIPANHFAAIVGPSGCGKSTLLKIITGISEPNEGNVYWQNRDLAEKDFAPAEIGYVPQFSIAYDLLSVWENIEAALHLRVLGLRKKESIRSIENILKQVGLESVAQLQVKFLSGGQRRRLALALEMVSSPALLLCDEVTSGLDPKAEEEITRLMWELSKQHNRTVLSVTHSMQHLSLYDSILVLHGGCLAYHGPNQFLLHHFGVQHAEEVFPRLTQRTPEEWHQSWIKRREAYQLDSGIALSRVSHVEDKHDPLKAVSRFYGVKKHRRTAQLSGSNMVLSMLEKREETDSKIPGMFVQAGVLLRRRWQLFFRDRSQAWLQLALLLSFPAVVVIFAFHGLPQIQNLNMAMNHNVVDQLREANQFIIQSSKVGTLVSGLVMFQVILLALMGSNNSAREIAAERLIFEKEKFAGLRPMSFLLSKASFLFVLVAVQSVWMAVFVNLICRFPGEFLTQILFLLGINAAVTFICLAVSSLAPTAEKASLISIYLVGFQLPLSGAVLALPSGLDSLTRPFISAYWSWSGIIQTMRDTRFYDVVQSITQTHLSSVPLCLWVLVSHMLLGFVLTYFGCKQSRWE